MKSMQYPTEHAGLHPASMLLFLLDQAALRACDYCQDLPNPPGGGIQRDDQWRTVSADCSSTSQRDHSMHRAGEEGPKLPPEHRLNSTASFHARTEPARRISVDDAGGGFQNYPEDYAVIEELHKRGEMTLRIAYNLFTQKPKQEKADFARWIKMTGPGKGDDFFRCSSAGRDTRVLGVRILPVSSRRARTFPPRSEGN